MASVPLIVFFFESGKFGNFPSSSFSAVSQAPLDVVQIRNMPGSLQVDSSNLPRPSPQRDQLFLTKSNFVVGPAQDKIGILSLCATSAKEASARLPVHVNSL